MSGCAIKVDSALVGVRGSRFFGCMSGFGHMVSTPHPLIFWNQSGSGRLGSKFLSSKGLQAKSWKQMGCGRGKALFIEEIYIHYRVYLIVKVKTIVEKSQTLCRNRKGSGNLQCGRLSLEFAVPTFTKSVKVGQPPYS